MFNSFKDAEYCIPYLTNLNTLELNSNTDSALLLLLIQHCHNIQHLRVSSLNISIQDILALLHRNLALKEFSFNLVNSNLGLTDTILIELIHACPHLHTLDISYETDITNIGILALSEHCPQLHQLKIIFCHKITETAILQLLQHCRQLKCLSVSKSSLSVETAAEVKRTRNVNIMRW